MGGDRGCGGGQGITAGTEDDDKSRMTGDTLTTNKGLYRLFPKCNKYIYIEITFT